MKMMKTVLLGVVAMVVGAAAFAADTYKVEKVTGKVTYEAAPGTWKNVTVGQEITATTNINTSLNSTLVVSNDGNSATIKAMQKGTVSKLAAAATGSAGGLKKATVTKGNVGGATNGAQSGVSTASSRASEAKEDAVWDE